VKGGGKKEETEIEREGRGEREKDRSILNYRN
jgi:hypothetical protein